MCTSTVLSFYNLCALYSIKALHLTIYFKAHDPVAELIKQLIWNTVC